MHNTQYEASQKMKNIIRPWLFLLIFSLVGSVVIYQMFYRNESVIEYSSVEDERALLEGQTLEFLLVSKGDPTEIKHLADKDEYLDSYYYHDSHTTYIVNTETGYICSVAKGKHTANCPDY